MHRWRLEGQVRPRQEVVLTGLTANLQGNSTAGIQQDTRQVMGKVEEVEVMSPGKWHTSNSEVCNVQSTAKPYKFYIDFDFSEQAKKLFSLLEMESSLEKEQKQALERIIEEFSDVFPLSPDELKCTELRQHI